VRAKVVVLLLCLTLAAPASGADAHDSWAKRAIASVTRAGLFAGTPATFRPSEPLTAQALASLVTAMGGRPRPVPADPSKPVTITGLDAALVDALGLRPTARALAAAARAGGLKPPPRFGTEVAARLLGMRTDLPIKDDPFELQPQQPATRADAAFSAARVLTLGHEIIGKPAPGLSPVALADAGLGVEYVRGIAATFVVPELTPLQQQILRTAISLVGYPYVWGGSNEKVEPGFDCSGLVWRVFGGTSYELAPGLADTIQGRTTAQMAGEVPRSERIGRADLEPGDVLFFGPRGTHSKAAQIDHSSIYIGNGWMIESSGQGVSLGLLVWDTKQFAWARRPIAEMKQMAARADAP
jgi:cell wall-associated NlpC family hydrolase